MKLVKFIFFFLVGGIFLSAILLAASIFMAPLGVKWYANSWFASHNLDSEIASVDVDLTDGLFIIDGLTVKDAEGVRLKIDHFLVQAKLLDLLNRKIKIENAKLDGLYIDLVKNKDNVIKYAGITAHHGGKVLPVENRPSNDIPWTILLKEIDLKNIKACYKIKADKNSPVFHDCAVLDELEWQGHLKYTLYNNQELKAAGLIISASIKLSGFSIDDKRLKRKVIRLDNMDVNGLTTAGINEIMIHGVVMDNYKAFQSQIVNDGIGTQPYLIMMDRVSFGSVSIHNMSNIEISSIDVDGMQANVSRDVDGNLNVEKTFSEFVASGNQSKQSSKETSEVSAPLSVNLKHLEIGGNSMIDIQDSSVTPQFVNQLSGISLKIDGIDTDDKSKSSKLRLAMTIGDHGAALASGNVKLFSELPTINSKVKLTGIDLVGFSAYINSLLQQEVKSGHLDAAVDLSINKGVIDTKSKIVLHKFYIEALSEEHASKYKERLGIPLNTALSLLRENDDRISISVPVTGNIDNPEFSLNDILRKVTADAIKTAVINYYTPFGLVKLLAAGYKLATALHFEPVLFDPAKSGLDEQDKEQLDKLANLLKQRPNIHLVICGQAVKKDFVSFYPSEARRLEEDIAVKGDQAINLSDGMDALNEKSAITIKQKQKKRLIDLAILRGKAVQQYLIEHYKVNPDRLILCNPKFSYADKGDARVDISI